MGEAKSALGIDPSGPLDTSPEATANRIADFALNFFEQFAENHPELDGKEARQAFADLIGGAIQEGIDEAKQILDSLSALTDGDGSDITTIQDIIQQRIDAFVNQDD